MIDTQREAQIIADTLYGQHNGNYKTALEQIDDEIRHAIYTEDSREQTIWEMAKTVVETSMENDQLDTRLVNFNPPFVSKGSKSRTIRDGKPRDKSTSGKKSDSKSRSRSNHGYNFHGRFGNDTVW